MVECFGKPSNLANYAWIGYFLQFSMCFVVLSRAQLIFQLILRWFMKKGILLVAFGANNLQAHQTLRLFDEKIRDRFDGVNVRLAFTSELIRDRLAAQRVKRDSVEKALEKMAFENYTHIAVQSLHIIPGVEFEELCEDAQGLVASGRLSKVAVGEPLLNSEEDISKVVAAVLDHLPQERTADEGVVFMGHGSSHEGDRQYDAVYRELQKVDPNLFLGTMDGNHTIEKIIPELTKRNLSRVWLMPFLSVVGRHARNDMAGVDKDSWKSQIEAAGIECEPVVVGLAEYSSFVDIWLSHLESTLTIL